jgi:hypothetical protein
MKMRRIGIALLALVLAGTGARATSLEKMSVERMTAAAPVVARVRCLANTARWEKGEIWTFTTFEVEERWKGDAPERIEVKQIGGRAGPVVSIVPGAPRFRPGEEAVLFLEPRPGGAFGVTGWSEGTFRIRRDARTGIESVTQDTAASSVFDPQMRRFRAEGIRALPLERLRARVAAAAKNGTGSAR